MHNKTALIPLLGLVLILFFGACKNDPVLPPESMLEVQDLILTIDENPPSGLLIDTVSAQTDRGILSFQLLEESPVGAFDLDGQSGELRVGEGSLFDFETTPLLTASVEVSNGEKADTAKVEISLRDVVENTGGDSTVWSGPLITFTKEDEADPTDSTNQDRITDNVWITRGNDGGQIFNIKVESEATKSVSPLDTEWALGELSQLNTLTFRPFREALGNPQQRVGQDLVVHLITDDIYLSIKLLSWSDNKKGGFSYERSTP
jgi:hypothetical protein